MKKIFNLMAVACAVMAFASCEKDNGGSSETDPNQPVMTWEANPKFETTELQSEMDVVISISAPAGIETFVVDIDSDALEPIISVVNNGSSTMDLVNPPAGLSGILSGVGLPTGDALKGQTSVTLDLSNLVPLIITVGESNLKPDSNHTFTLSLSDADGRTLQQPVTFHYTGTSASAE